MVLEPLPLLYNKEMIIMFGTIGQFITPTNILMAGKVFLDYNKGKKGVKTAESISKINLRREQAMYEYNKKNLQDSYDMSFQSYMGKYVEDRMAIADQYTNAQSNLNMVASQMGYNLVDSSFTNDIQDQLDREYTTELQDTYSNLTMKLNELMFNKNIREVELNNQLNKSVTNINSTMAGIKQQTNDLFYNSLTDLGLKLYDDYRGIKAKDKLAGTDLATNKYTFKEVDTLDNLLNFSFK